MIDSHCHLADKQFTLDLPQVLERAKKAGVDRMITIADSLEESEKCIELATKYPELFASVGVHPHNAKTWKTGSGDQLKKLALSSDRVKAIGEIGLDYHYDFSSPDEQRRAFADQLTIARELGLPIVIHCREAIADLKSILIDSYAERYVLHCCSEKWEDIEELNCFLSFTGIATYPNADVIRDTVKHCPLEKMMIETDAPYLAPIPYRGKRNEPAFVVETAKKIAEIKGISVEEVATQTAQNAIRFFGLPS